MRKILFMLVLCFTALTASAQIKSLEVKTNLRGDFGLGVGVTMPATASLDFAPSFNYYFGSDNTFTLDGDFRWNIDAGSLLTVYPLAGPAIFHASGDCSVTKIGLNLGVGGSYYVNDRISVFGEAKYQFLFNAHGADDTFASVGVSFAID